jgi:hypothetical protein
MIIIQTEKHPSNGLFYVKTIEGVMEHKFLTFVDIATYSKLAEDHERNLGLLKILLKSTHLENFIKVE